MARPKPATFDKQKIVAENRRARFDYFIEDTYEAGIALSGTEVKSLRGGEGSIAESYAEIHGGEAWLVNANIPEFSHGNRFNHEPKRPRKLLLHAREVEKMVGAVERKGMTLVPLSVYFNSRGGARQADSRQAPVHQGTRLEARQSASDAGAWLRGFLGLATQLRTSRTACSAPIRESLLRHASGTQQSVYGRGDGQAG